MKTTTNFKLKAYEGTDLFNPLTVESVNVEEIDKIMYGNKTASVQPASEVKTGANHSITRNTPDASVFRFVATSQWVVGDTCSVDGVSVTAIMPNGEALKTGAWQINGNVLCILTGTLLTVFTNTPSGEEIENAGSHNCVYRGKFLGTTVTAAQYLAIANGDFTGLYIGDYWAINDVNYRIAGFDYFFNMGDVPFNKHHAVIVPDTPLYNAQMTNTASGQYEAGDSNTTYGGYVGTDMYKANLNQAKTLVKNAFPGHVLKHRVFLTNAVVNGVASGVAWCDSEIDLMCEQMVYGCGMFSPVSVGNDNVPANYRIETSQLPLFRHEPSRICNRASWWLRDVINTKRFATVDKEGYCSYFDSTDAQGVRPAFCIG